MSMKKKRFYIKHRSHINPTNSPATPAVSSFMLTTANWFELLCYFDSTE